MAGDRRSISTFVDIYGRFVYNVIYRILGSVAEAEEATQDTIMKIINNLQSYDTNSSLKAWSYTIAYRTAIDYKRKSKIYDDLAKAEYVSSTQDIEDKIKEQDNNLMINRMMKVLDDDAKTIITLYYLEEKSIKEIIEYTGLTESNIKIKLYRARKQMAEIFKNQISL